ncbi:uncharacterized protein LOC127867294 [Dreissena polymorpha]|uniref:Chitin-binding type-2 domain-containing protein n=1 Tax=Dreissena polymorpha TaxID=45954 RepID=A0A9D4NBJ2_DREPO|nr:uncharacterized protein LOC127867294 [Dreissena polymorpha]KAH3890724.1 hypothetical protein DPMN_014812 [Dreissena polymorpha]
MEKYLPILAIMSFLVSTCSAIVCVGMPDGVYETNCQAFTRCVGGETEIVNCEGETAYNQETKQCQRKWDVPPPCGTYRECSDLKDGFYPDMETNCHSYYICVGGAFLGHSLCPAGLVYNRYQGVCDYNYNAPPPCGINATAAPGI